jgi:hypothetical protein
MVYALETFSTLMARSDMGEERRMKLETGNLKGERL